MNIGDLWVRFLGDTKDVESKLQGLGNSPSVQAAGTKAGALFAGAVKPALKLLGPAVGAGFAEGVNSAAQFADQIATIDTVLGKGQAEMLGLDKAALKLSADTGKPIEDITSGLYDLVSAGIPADKAIETLRASTNLAIGGLGTTADAVDAVTSAMNAYGQGTYTATQITDIFARAVQDGKVKTSEIGASISAVAPIAAQAGIKLEEVSAAYARLTANGVPAAEVTQNMRQAIVALISPNETLAKVQAKTGINFAQLAKEKGLSVALDKLREVTGATGSTFGKFSDAVTAAGSDTQKVHGVIKAFQEQLGLTDKQAADFEAAVGNEGMGQALADLAHNIASGDAAFSDSLGRVQAYQYALLTTGDNAETFGNELKGVYDSTGLAAQQAATKMDSPVEAGKRLSASFKALVIGTFGPFADSLGPIVVGLNQTGGAMSALIRPATLIGGLLGKVLQPVAGAILSSLAGLGAKVAAKLGIELAVATAEGAAAGAATGAAEVGAQTATVAAGQGAVAAAATGPAVAAGAEIGAAMGGAEAAAEVETASVGVAEGQAAVGAAGAAGAGVSGGILGKIMGGGLKAGLVLAAAGLWLEVVNTYNDQKAKIAAQTEAIGASIGKQLTAGSLTDLQKSQAALQSGIAQLSAIPDFGILTGDPKAKLQAQLDAVNAELNSRYSKLGQVGFDNWAAESQAAGERAAAAIATGMRKAEDLGPAEATVIRAKVKAQLAPMTVDAYNTASAAAGKIASGIRDRRSSVDAAFDQLKTDLKNRLSPMKELAHDIGLLTSKRLAAGLRSNDPVVKAQAEATRDLILGRLEELQQSGAKLGKAATAELNAALHSKDAQIKKTAETTKAIIDAGLKGPPGKSKETIAGEKAGSDLAAGLLHKGTAVGNAAIELGDHFARSLLATLRSYTGGSTSSGSGVTRPRAYAQGTDYAVGGMALVGEVGPELVVLPTGAQVIPNHRLVGPAQGGPAGGYPPVQIIMPGPATRDPFEVLNRAWRLQRFGFLNPYARPSGA